MGWILPFEEVTHDLADDVGSKCANLGELLRLGMPVPPGFVITTEACAFFLAETGAGDEIHQSLENFGDSPDSIEACESLSQRLEQIIESKKIPAALEESILRAYETLGHQCQMTDVAVAVRSSGGSEDLPTAAFAGQYDSYLKVKGAQDLLAKIKDCWASLFTARVISYRLKNHLPVMDKLMGVIVQRVVNARTAGVAFTALPTTGNPAWVMMEGNWGTAESVVQGTVNPDKCYVNKESLTIEEMRISQKLTQYSLDGAGTREETIPIHMQSVPCFSEEEVTKIAELAKQVEAHYGAPQDIEWVIERDLPFPENIFLVQTRPITALQRKSAADQVADLMLTRYIKR
jgi:pyruvate,water dikinase